MIFEQPVGSGGKCPRLLSWGRVIQVHDSLCKGPEVGTTGMVCLEGDTEGEMEMESENSRWSVRNDIEPFGFRKQLIFYPNFFFIFILYAYRCFTILC